MRTSSLTAREMEALYREDHSCAEIGVIAGITGRAVYGHLRKANVKMRPAHRRMGSGVQHITISVNKKHVRTITEVLRAFGGTTAEK